MIVQINITLKIYIIMYLCMTESAIYLSKKHY